VAPGGQVRVLGTGGYVVDPSGLNDESARYFELFLDGNHLGTLACYLNHCLADLSLPAGLAPGEHTLSVEGGSSLTIEIR
jgi:hypothetical protein